MISFNASLRLLLKQGCDAERFWTSKRATSTSVLRRFLFPLQRRVTLGQIFSSAAVASLTGQVRASQRHSRTVFELTETPLFSYTARGLSGAFLKLCRKVKIDDLHFHDLRHEATSRLFEKGLNPVEVATITGHKDTRMLMRYTHLRAEDLVGRLGQKVGYTRKPLWRWGAPYSRLKFRIHPLLEGLRTNYLYMKQIVELSCSSYGWCLQANGLTVGNGTILAHFPTTPSGHNLGNLEGVSVQRTSSATTEISRWLTK